MIDNMHNIIQLKLNSDLDVELIDELEDILDSSLYSILMDYIYNDVDFTGELAGEINIYL